MQCKILKLGLLCFYVVKWKRKDACSSVFQSNQKASMMKIYETSMSEMSRSNDDFLFFPELGESDYFDVLPRVQAPEYYRREKGGRKRKRRCMNPTFMPEIRILRRDIRRRYAEMLLCVANAHDLSLLEKFVEDVFHPDCQIIRMNPSHSEISKTISVLVFNQVSHNMIVSGVKELQKEYSYHCELVPDSVFILQNSFVRVKQGFGGSVVTAQCIAKGTQMFQFESKENDHRLNSVPVPVPIPIETTTELGFVLILDEINRIKQFHIESYTLLESPVSVNEI